MLLKVASSHICMSKTIFLQAHRNHMCAVTMTAGISSIAASTQLHRHAAAATTAWHRCQLHADKQVHRPGTWMRRSSSMYSSRGTVMQPE